MRDGGRGGEGEEKVNAKEGNIRMVFTRPHTSYVRTDPFERSFSRSID